MIEIEDDMNSWKDTLCSWTGRNNIAKMTMQSMHCLHIYRFNVIPNKIPVAFFTN